METYSHRKPEDSLTAMRLDIEDSPKDILRKILSTGLTRGDSSLGVIQYHEAWKENIREEHKTADPARSTQLSLRGQAPLIRAIGWGSCGAVYQELGTTHVLKRAINQNSALSEECRLLNDLVMHKAVEEAFHGVVQEGVASRVLVPRLYTYMSRSDQFCRATHTRLFPVGEQILEDLLISERILLIYLVARHALIDLYCPEELKDGAKRQDSNDDCLVRLYLGKRLDQVNRLRSRKFFGLRNFPLCLDQMQDLGLDTTTYALAIAEALAIMHWKTKIDAADVEFVLGGPPCLTHVPLPTCQQILELQGGASISTPTSHFMPGATQIWLLDFNQCQPLSMDESGVDRAVKRFFDNDPYYPRPPIDHESTDMEVWKAFESRYLAVSQRLADDNHQALPALFIHRVKVATLQRLKIKAEAAQLSDEYSKFEAGLN